MTHFIVKTRLPYKEGSLKYWREMAQFLSKEYDDIRNERDRLVTAIKKLSVYGDEKKLIGVMKSWTLYPCKPWQPAQDAIESVKDILDEIKRIEGE